ncbi:MAG: FAD:protein FMN transferase [Bacteroidales bacterium]|nr:FAD:protein FMN transferase [Bacteroidales bacterium]
MPHLSRTIADGSVAVYVWFEAMHTRVDILLKSSCHSESALLEVTEGMKRIIAGLEKVGNRFDPSSELAHLNRLPAGEEVEISASLYDMLSLCLYYNVRTKGLFDISVSSPGFEPGMLSSIRLGEGGRFCRSREDVVLDLSGFIKGYALDQLRIYLVECGLENALVNLGNSSIMAMGDVPGPVRNGCLTTSGNSDPSRRHIRNPLSGEYIGGARTAQVFTPGGAEGEVEATVKFITETI